MENETRQDYAPFAMVYVKESGPPTKIHGTKDDAIREATAKYNAEVFVLLPVMSFEPKKPIVEFDERKFINDTLPF